MTLYIYLSREEIVTWGKSAKEGISWASFFVSAKWEWLIVKNIMSHTHPMVIASQSMMGFDAGPGSLQFVDVWLDKPNGTRNKMTTVYTMT